MAGRHFRLSLILVGLGQGLFLVPTLFYATRDLKPEHGTTAAALFNLSRIVGQTFGIGVVSADQVSRGFPFRAPGGKRQQRQLCHGGTL
jgi:hypothetical protein